MGSIKGKSNNPKGKPKGTKNKDLKPIREKFDQLLGEYSIEQMSKDLKSLDPGQRLNIIMGLSEYIIPKLSRTDSTVKIDDNTINITREIINGDSV